MQLSPLSEDARLQLESGSFKPKKKETVPVEEESESPSGVVDPITDELRIIRIARGPYERNF